MVRLRQLSAIGTMAALVAVLWLASPVTWQSVAHASSTDATLSALALKTETHLWVVAPPGTTWDVDVPNFVSTLTVDALPSNSQASYKRVRQPYRTLNSSGQSLELTEKATSALASGH